MKTRHVNLDVIRIIAILLVFNFHFCGLFSLVESPLYKGANGGTGLIGVTMFYLLSGFLLEKGDVVLPLNTYYKKRFLTIYPMIWMMFPVFYLIQALRTGSFLYGGAPWKVLLSLLGVDSYVQLYGVQTYYVIGEWFTAVIVVVYLLYPLLQAAIRKSEPVTGIVLFALYFGNILIGIQKGITPDASIFTGLFLFYVGMLLRRHRGLLETYRIPIMIASATVMLLTALVRFPKIGGYGLLWTNLLGGSLFLLIYLMLRRTTVSGFLKSAICLVSSVTYGIYLCHHRILELALVFLPYRSVRGLIFIYAVTLAASFGVSAVFYFIYSYKICK